MMTEVISKHFAEFVVFKLENKNDYEVARAFITEGTFNGVKVVIVQYSENWLIDKIQTLQDTYTLILLEYLEYLE